MLRARTGSLMGLAAAIAIAGAARGQNAPVEQRSARTVSAVDHELALTAQRIERLREESQRLEQEDEGITPRRLALSQRARGEIRFLYHLLQGQVLARQSGPEALMEQTVRVSRLRRTLRDTLVDIDRAAHRAVTVRSDRTRIATLLHETEERRGALEHERQQVEVLSGMQLAVTNAGLANDGAGVGAEPATTVYGGSVGATGSSEAMFSQSAGRLLFPVAGRAEMRRAQREGADGPGVEIRVPLGSPVRAVFPGRVAFSDRYGPYGRIVILDHGEHYYSVSANLGSINVHVGEEVSTGTVLGTVGDDGRGPMLYFEVRRGSDTVDPTPWLGM